MRWYKNDQKITDEKELKEYMEHLELIGEGGTDFRPAFEYVNHLIEQGEFYHLKGLIYFTDGKGTYPKKKPPYQTAFIFYAGRIRRCGCTAMGS